MNFFYNYKSKIESLIRQPSAISKQGHCFLHPFPHVSVVKEAVKLQRLCWQGIDT